MQGHVTGAVSKPTADVATTFQATCTSQSNTELMCAASATFISTSNTGNLGRRAGALCSMLGGLLWRQRAESNGDELFAAEQQIL
jgi:hypothetical protein